MQGNLGRAGGLDGYGGGGVNVVGQPAEGWMAQQAQ